MDRRAEIREFLVSRWAKLTPGQVGLPRGGERRVPGLRRTEMAALAGVSVEYYSRLERGAFGGVSTSVLDSILRAPDQSARERGGGYAIGDQPKEGRAGQAELACHCILSLLQQSDGRQYPVAGSVRDLRRVPAVDDKRGWGEGYAGAVSDVLHRGPPRALPG